jgi:protein tyrosine/serine phosphatase
MPRFLIPMIYRGELATARGRRSAWLDSFLVDHALLRTVWKNFAVVSPGRLYRANHPTPGGMARLTRRYGIRTVINLRGASGNGSDALSREAARRLGIQFVDAPLSSGQPPSRERLLGLISALRNSAEPVLVHCKSGADRAGFAAGIFALLNGGTTNDALRHLSLRHGHMKGSRAGILDAFFLAYRREAEGRCDFEAWVRERYDPAALRRDGPAGRLARFVNDRLLARE